MFCFLLKIQNLSDILNDKNNLYRLPFELNSARRFACVNVVQSMSCWTGTTILITIVSMYFGIILYIQAFLKDFTFFFDEMDTFAEQDNLPALNDKFDSLIKFHVYILEYVIQLNVIKCSKLICQNFNTVLANVWVT